ncbi:OmpP1/FadL family transporter [Thermodesulfobacteriota bacterium]
MKKLFLTLSLLPALIVLLPCSVLFAQTPLPFDELGAGPRATAMGQAFTALADDPAAAYYNPAGLTQIKSPFHLTLGFQYAKPLVTVAFDEEPVQNPWLGRGEFSQTEDLATHGLYVGYCFNFSEISAFSDSAIASRISHGMTLFTNIPEVNQFDNPQRPQDPYVFKYNERWSLISLAISFAFRCTDWLSIGGGILPRVDSIQESRGSWITLNGVIDPDDPSRGMRLDLRATTKINVVPIAGILVRPPIGSLRDKVSIGVSYRGKIWGFYGTGMTTVDIVIERPNNPPILLYRDPGGKTIDYIGFTPQQVTVGVAWKPSDKFTAAFDLTWKDYSEFHFFWDMPPDPAFVDVWVPRMGLSYRFEPDFEGKYPGRFEAIEVMTGYYRENSPVPDMSGPMNILDADQNVISGGVAIRYDAAWTGHVKLEAFFQAHLLEDNRIENDDDLLFGPVTVGGKVYNGGIAISIVY